MDCKGWCNTERSTDEQTRKEKTLAIETLHAEIDELKASIAKLREDIAELTAAKVELDEAMAKATVAWQAEKAKNEETIKDAQDAQHAYPRRLAVWQCDEYAKNGSGGEQVEDHARRERERRIPRCGLRQLTSRGGCKVRAGRARVQISRDVDSCP